MAFAPLTYRFTSSITPNLPLVAPLKGLRTGHGGDRIRFSGHGDPVDVFKSDNVAPILREYEITRMEANTSAPHPPYGNDRYTQRLRDVIQAKFGPTTQLFMVNSGTAANRLALESILSPVHSVICSQKAHIKTLEANAIRFDKLGIGSANGTFSVKEIQETLRQNSLMGAPFNTRPTLISIEQSTSVSDYFEPKQIKEICDFAHNNQMLVHMDGARLWNVAAKLNLPLRALTADLGVDILYLGGSKNGMDNADLVLFLPSFFEHYPKLFGQHNPPMNQKDRERFFEDLSRFSKHIGSLNAKWVGQSAQFLKAFENNFGIQRAAESNHMASHLDQAIRQLPPDCGVQLQTPTKTNAVYVTLPLSIAEKLKDKYSFYKWGQIGDKVVARFMTSSTVKESDVRGLMDTLKTFSLADQNTHLTSKSFQNITGVTAT